ncbi:MAG: KEOPS complex subunit Pcc1 [Thermoproteota archaeon]|nr:KEOPS complex subunit Pcc1 [Thermoproteota archaeon]
MKAHVTVTLSFPSKKRLNTVLQALKPETKSSPTLRSRVELQGKGKSLTLRFEAKDTTALRASVNSYLRWISSTEAILETVNTLSFKDSLGKAGS